MLIGTYSGFNAHIGHPLSNLFLKQPSWDAIALEFDDYIAAMHDKNRTHPLWSHAVFDTEEQVFERWSWIESDPNLYVVSLTTLRKEDEPYEGGWRWHKWGDYLGDKEPQHEYLAHEGPDITQVVVVQVHEINEDAHSHARLQALAFMEETTAGNYEGF